MPTSVFAGGSQPPRDFLPTIGRSWRPSRHAEGPRALADGVEIRPARAEEAEELLPLMRAYCDFYEASPPDEGLLEMMRTLSTDPSHGALFIARDGERAVGFAALDWKWSSLNGARIGYLEDLFVDPGRRGRGSPMR